MKPIKIMGLCLVAVFVMTAVVTTAASAARATKPYWDQCSKVETAGEGKWQNNLCSVEKTSEANGLWSKVEIGTKSAVETGEFKECALTQTIGEGVWKDGTCTGVKGAPNEFVKVTHKHQFTSTSGPSELLIENSMTSKFTPVKCKSDTNEGHVIGPKHILVTVHFKGCESEIKGVKTPCKSAGANPEEIVTKQLKGWLFYISSTVPEVGLWLSANSGKEFATFECATQKVIVKSIEKISEAVEPETGSCIAGKVTSALNTMGKQGSLAFEGTEKEQKWEKFEYEGKKLHCRLKVKIGTEEFNSTQITKEDSIEWEDAMQLNA